MEVSKLIKVLELLPKGSTIGRIDELDLRITDGISIYTRDSSIFTCSGDKAISEIECARLSNSSKICDYYIG